MRRIHLWMGLLGAAALIGAGPAFGAQDDLPPSTDAKSAQDRVEGDAQRDDRSGDRQNPERQRPLEQTPAHVAAEGEYVVEEGDTLAGIAKQELGAADQWQVIARANGIDDPKQLRVGQRLKIPARDRQDLPGAGDPQRGQDPRQPRQDRDELPDPLNRTSSSM